LIADFKPEVLLLDLHLAEKREFTPALVKLQLASVGNVLAVPSSGKLAFIDDSTAMNY
jgi:hypothetical protein